MDEGHALLDRLPIIVGVTGHRDLRPQDVPSLEQAVGHILDTLRRDHPKTPLLMLTPLAEGADQLLARVARERGIPYLVPMPMPLQDYRQDFITPETEATFDELIGHALGTYAMPFFGTNDAGNVHESERRAHQYALVGAHVARASHVLIALWNGEFSDRVGGTSTIVRFRCYGSPRDYQQAGASLLDAPEKGAVYHVYAPRRSRPDVVAFDPGFTRRFIGGEPTAADAFPLIELEKNAPDPFAPLYQHIEEFNADCLLVRPRPTTAASQTERLRQIASKLSTYYQKKKARPALDQVFLATGAAAIVLAIYAHLFPVWRAFAEQAAWPKEAWYFLVIPYFSLLLLALFVYRRARDGAWQDKAQDYRALEMGLRVQGVWDKIGLDVSVADVYIRRQRSELDWIREAIRTVHNIDRVHVADKARGLTDVREFILGQRDYFATRGKEEKATHERFERLAAGALTASFAASAVLLIFALFMLIAPAFRTTLAADIAEQIDGVLIVMLSCSAICAALWHDYPQRRAVHQHATRYHIMRDIYDRALAALGQAENGSELTEADGLAARIRVAQEVINEIGREALTENGDWVILHRELPLELLALP